MKLLQTSLLVFLSTVSMAAAPKGWIVAGSAPDNYEFGTDVGKAGDATKSAFIKSKPGIKDEGFGTLMQMFAADEYRGGRWKLSARMRTEDAKKVQLWMRVDGPDRKMNAFYNMDDRPVTGDTEWKTYEIVLDVAPDSVAVAFGFFIFGNGQAWADDFKLERVGNDVPVSASPRGQQRTNAPTNLSFDE
ncbi:MAG: hypothetical protein ABUU24_03545 [Variovorax sp.]